jgi:hypothetical protein
MFNEMIVTERRGNFGQWMVKANLNIKVGLWTVLRWPVEGPFIPPRGQVMTDDGWKPILATGGLVFSYHTEAEVSDIIVNTCQ